MKYIFATYFLLLQIASAASIVSENHIAQGTETEQEIQTISIRDTKDPEFKSFMVAGREVASDR